MYLHLPSACIYILAVICNMFSSFFSFFPLLLHSEQLCLTGSRGGKGCAETPTRSSLGHPGGCAGWMGSSLGLARGTSTAGRGPFNFCLWKGKTTASSAKHFFPCSFSFLFPLLSPSSPLLQSVNNIWQILAIVANGLGMMELVFLQMC